MIINNMCKLSSMWVIFLFTLYKQGVQGRRNRGHDHGGREYNPEPKYKPQPFSPMFRETNRNITVGPGERAVLKCIVDNLGTKTVTWRRDKEEHPLTIGLFTFVSDTRITVDYNQRSNEWSLMIQDITPEDEGIYHCVISSKEDGNKSYEIKLNVKSRTPGEYIPFLHSTHSPSITSPRDTKRKLLNGNNCPEKVVWSEARVGPFNFTHSILFCSSPRGEQTPTLNSTHSALTPSIARKGPKRQLLNGNDCPDKISWSQAQVKPHNYTHSILLCNVEDVAGPAVQVYGHEYVEQGEKITLVCNATGKPHPPHDVTWFKDGQQISSDASSGVLITKKIETRVLISVLVIKGASMEDGGAYICMSSNRDAGKISVHILNIPAGNVKRGTVQEKHSSNKAHIIMKAGNWHIVASLISVTLFLHIWKHWGV